KNVRHAMAAGDLVGEDRRGTLVRRASHFACPHGNAVAHAARHELKPKVSPIGWRWRFVEPRLVVEAVQIGTDELAVLHTNAGIINEIRYAAGGIDLVIWTVTGARLGLDDLDAVLERLLYNDDAREPSVW